MKLDKFKTSIEYSKNLFTTGALFETSREVEIEICNKLPSGSGKIVVEFGMGHGNITKEILRRISPDSTLYSFEINEKFCEHVDSDIDDKRLIIINDNAKNLEDHIDSSVDAFIGSIPFSFFSKDLGQKILQQSYDLLNPNGYYSQVLYTKFNFKKFKHIFDECHRIKIPNILTEYVFHCQKIPHIGPLNGKKII